MRLFASRQSIWAFAVTALALSACGSDGSFRTDPDAVYARAMRLVHAGDWKGLEPLLTTEARASLLQVLQRLRSRLAVPETSVHERRLARERLGPWADRALEEAIHGDWGAQLRFVVRVSPRDVRPEASKRELGPDEIEYLYSDGRGVQHAVRLVRAAGGWYVDELQL